MKRGLNIHINFTNRAIYTFVAFIIILIIGVGVFAYNTSNPTIFGHSAEEIEEVDPTVAVSVKDGVDWGEISEIPPDFADNIDNTSGGCDTFTYKKTKLVTEAVDPIGTTSGCRKADWDCLSQYCRSAGYNIGREAGIWFSADSGIHIFSCFGLQSKTVCI